LLSNITDKDAVDQILLDNEFQNANKKGKRIYYEDRNVKNDVILKDKD